MILIFVFVYNAESNITTIFSVTQKKYVVFTMKTKTSIINQKRMSVNTIKQRVAKDEEETDDSLG